MKTQFTLTRNAALSLLVLGFAVVTAVVAVNAQADETTDSTQTTVVHGPFFVDENGDGYNDNAPDDDGDGIPNGQDTDYTRPANGQGKHLGSGKHLGNGKSNATVSGKGNTNSGRRGNGKGKGACVADRNSTTDESSK